MHVCCCLYLHKTYCDQIISVYLLTKIQISLLKNYTAKCLAEELHNMLRITMLQSKKYSMN